MPNVVGLIDIKQALNDERFCNLFPELREEINKYHQESHCGACQVPLIQKILNQFPDRVQQYFPNKKVVKPEEEMKKLMENNWKVINCNIDELEQELKKLTPGRKQVAITRYENQVTVVINELSIVY